MAQSVSYSCGRFCRIFYQNDHEISTHISSYHVILELRRTDSWLFLSSLIIYDTVWCYYQCGAFGYTVNRWWCISETEVFTYLSLSLARVTRRHQPLQRPWLSRMPQRNTPLPRLRMGCPASMPTPGRSTQGRTRCLSMQLPSPSIQPHRHTVIQLVLRTARPHSQHPAMYQWVHPLFTISWLVKSRWPLRYVYTQNLIPRIWQNSFHDDFLFTGKKSHWI